ncbi:hypothetical protein [Thermus tengchongensis]|jgi:hypothetical protein|uniref:Uncharacterized protein n=1 Tax=Thermus tengchongensis TaxID=1214928 RepID=A0A4Y9F7B2_9DEIN|nr:hypothetical protein [Thermus tengchongensis]TFU25054.1 hypothetical protein E0687_12715 [Thermus tengchongensis]
MDYLYPPKRLLFLAPEQVQAWVRAKREREDREDEDRPPLRGLDTIPSDAYREVVAVGLYVSNVDHALQKPLRDRAEAEPEGALRNGPGIFLCPERVLSWGDRHGIDPSLVLDKVYYHELAHAFMDTGPTPYDELWGRIVEESLANWLSYQRFSGKEARWVQRLIQDEPAEYQGYLAVGQWAGWWPSTEDGTDLIRAAHFWFRGFFTGLGGRRLPRWVYRELWETYEAFIRRWYRILEWGFPVPPLLPILPLNSTQIKDGLVPVQIWRRAKARNLLTEDENRWFWARLAERVLEETFA